MTIKECLAEVTYTFIVKVRADTYEDARNAAMSTDLSSVDIFTGDYYPVSANIVTGFIEIKDDR